MKVSLFGKETSYFNSLLFTTPGGYPEEFVHDLDIKNVSYDKLLKMRNSFAEAIKHVQEEIDKRRTETVGVSNGY